MISWKKLILGSIAIAAASSCGKKKEDDAAASTPSTIADLKLSSAMKLTLPDGLVSAAGGTSASLNVMNLLSGKRSSEACRTIETTRNVLSNLDSIGSTFCHFEVEKDGLKFGKKYTVKFIGETPLAAETMNIWVDNSKSDTLAVYMCKNGKIREQFDITGFAGEAGLVKGSVNLSFDEVEDSSTYVGGINMTFDFTTKGVQIVKSQMKNTVTGGSFAGSFSSAVDMTLRDSGLNAVTMSNSGSRGTDTMSDQGAVLFNGTVGQALFGGTGSYNGGTYNFTSRSTFDKDGIAISKTSATSDVTVDKTSLPAKLTSSFAPTAPVGWDCSEATETLTIDFTDVSKKAAHDACDKNKDHSYKECWGSDFAYGEHE